MRRREFIGLVGGTAAAWPVVVRAQQAERMRRIGVLASLFGNDPEALALLKAFRDELQRLGWEQDRNLRIEYRLSGGDLDRLRTDAA